MKKSLYYKSLVDFLSLNNQVSSFFNADVFAESSKGKQIILGIGGFIPTSVVDLFCF